MYAVGQLLSVLAGVAVVACATDPSGRELPDGGTLALDGGDLAADSGAHCHNAGNDPDRTVLKREQPCYQQEWRQYSADHRN